MKKIIHVFLFVFICTELMTAQITINLDARSNIFASGRTIVSDPGGGGGGILPFELALDCTVKKIIFPKVTGLLGITGQPSSSPDGWSSVVNISEFEGLSGVISEDYGLFMAGVFLDDSVPNGIYQGGPNVVYTDLIENKPSLNQIFFIGDGLTGAGSGELQEFIVPKGATRLFLGFPDAPYFEGPHGYYGDNIGSIDVTIETCSAIDVIKASDFQISLCKGSHSSQLDLSCTKGTVRHSVVMSNNAIEFSLNMLNSGTYEYTLIDKKTDCDIVGNVDIDIYGEDDSIKGVTNSASAHSKDHVSIVASETIYEILWQNIFSDFFSDDSNANDYTFLLRKSNNSFFVE